MERAGVLEVMGGTRIAHYEWRTSSRRGRLKMLSAARVEPRFAGFTFESLPGDIQLALGEAVADDRREYLDTEMMVLDVSAVPKEERREMIHAHISSAVNSMSRNGRRK